MQKWKFAAVTVKGSISDEKLNELMNSWGVLGWDLVSVVTLADTRGNIGTSGAGVGYTSGTIKTELEIKLFFKTPIS